MKWKAPRPPEDGDIRTRIRFAWVPLRDPAAETTYWMQRVWVKERYIEANLFAGSVHDVHGPLGRWRIVEASDEPIKMMEPPDGIPPCPPFPGRKDNP